MRGGEIPNPRLQITKKSQMSAGGADCTGVGVIDNEIVLAFGHWDL
jgi:hypothetical protein